jgi:hypothetical protein
MSADDHKPCFGTIFPDTLHAGNDRWIAGKAFSFRLVTAGGMLRSGREVQVNRAEWDDCSRCEEFENCYKFCLGKLALEAAIANA